MTPDNYDEVVKYLDADLEYMNRIGGQHASGRPHRRHLSALKEGLISAHRPLEGGGTGRTYYRLTDKGARAQARAAAAAAGPGTGLVHLPSVRPPRQRPDDAEPAAVVPYYMTGASNTPAPAQQQNSGSWFSRLRGSSGGSTDSQPYYMTGAAPAPEEQDSTPHWMRRAAGAIAGAAANNAPAAGQAAKTGAKQAAWIGKAAWTGDTGKPKDPTKPWWMNV